MTQPQPILIPHDSEKEEEKFSIQKLKEMKEQIEHMQNVHQIEILRILYNSENVTMNENKSGNFVNMSKIPTKTLESILHYIHYVKTQEKELNSFEVEKEKYKKIMEDNAIAKTKNKTPKSEKLTTTHTNKKSSK